MREREAARQERRIVEARRKSGNDGWWCDRDRLARRCEMRRGRKWARDQMVRTRMMGRLLRRNNMVETVDRTDDERRSRNSIDVGHPARRHKGAQQHRVEREDDGCGAEGCLHGYRVLCCNLLCPTKGRKRTAGRIASGRAD